MSAEIGEISTQTYLPEEIMIQILLRLPPKTLVRFKSVSKAWLSLIDGSFFVNRHLDFINTAAINHRRHLLYRLWKPRTAPTLAGVTFLLGPTGEIMDIEDAPCLDGDHQLGLHGRIISQTSPIIEDGEEIFTSPMWGPVNAVYCIMMKAQCSGYCTILLWNPGNRQVHVLPPIPPPVFPSPLAEYLEDDHVKEQHLLCGYGYDCFTNDYKVILTTVYGDEFDYSFHHYCFHLYSLAANAWKQLDPFEIVADTTLIKEYAHGGIALVQDISDSFFLSWDCGFYLNGGCHWVLKCMGSNKGILTFDFGGMVFQVTYIPKAIVELEGKHATLAAVDGCLAVVCGLDNKRAYPGASHVFDVCVMRENGVEDSWERAYRIVLTSSSPGRFIGIVDDEFFVREADGNGRVVSYQLGVHEVEKGCYEYCCFDDQWIRILPYRESLVPIKPRGN